MTRTSAAVSFAALLLASAAQAQTIGPDIINSYFIDVARYGTDVPGTTTAYAIGATTCNHGDVPAIVWPSGSSVRPLVAQNIYRIKTDPSGAFQRFEQLGESWVKRVSVPGQGTGTGCGACTPGPSGTMGVNCADAYGSGFNGSQSLLGPRSYINATTGVSAGNPTPVGDSVTRGRIQVPTIDIVNQPVNTHFFGETVHILPHDAQYVRPGQTVAVNALNNASSQEININGGTGAPSLMGGSTLIMPAIARWQTIDPAVTLMTADLDDAPNPSTTFPGTFIRARFYAAVRTTSIAGGNWRYEYAIFNLNSDRAGGSFTIPFPSSANISAVTFHSPLSHSGEVWSNAPWTASRTGDTLTFATEAYAANPNANALHWGTMYNFGFTTNIAPVTGVGYLGLFKPGAVNTLSLDRLSVPNVRYCSADFNDDGLVGADSDIEAFFSCLAGNCCASCESADFNNDGDAATDGDIESFFRVLAGAAC